MTNSMAKVCCGLALVAGCVDSGKLGANSQGLSGSGISDAGLDGGGSGSGGGPSPVFHTTWSGRSADVSGFFGQTYLGLQASENASGGTRSVTLSFGFGGADLSSGQIVTETGFGIIPSSAFQADPNSARLQVTTDASFSIMRCTFNWWDWTSQTCTAGGSETFDVTWTANHVSSSDFNGVSHTTFGPYMTQSHGAYSVGSADVTGTAAGFALSGPYGDIADTHGGSVTRDVYAVH